MHARICDCIDPRAGFGPFFVGVSAQPFAACDTWRHQRIFAQAQRGRERFRHGSLVGWCSRGIAAGSFFASICDSHDVTRYRSVVVCKRRRGCQCARFRRRCGGGPPPSLHWDVEPGRSGSLFFNNQVDPPRSDWTVLDARRWRFANQNSESEMEAFLLGVKWAGRQHSFRGTIPPF